MREDFCFTRQKIAAERVQLARRVVWVVASASAPIGLGSLAGDVVAGSTVGALLAIVAAVTLLYGSP